MAQKAIYINISNGSLFELCMLYSEVLVLGRRCMMCVVGSVVRIVRIVRAFKPPLYRR